MTITSILPANLQPYAKTIVAVLGIALTVVSVVFADAEWLPAVVSAATALGVYTSPNADAPEAVQTDSDEDLSAETL